MPVVELKNVSNYVCRNVNLQVFDKEMLVLLGPNGAGKTTLLNVIAGFADYSGTVFFDDVCVDGISAGKRSIGYLFQNLLLFPHLNVFNNIAYGLRCRGFSKPQINARVNQLLDMLNLQHLSQRYPKYLSGGEKQRVALARALAPSPKLLLLDEPLSSLDFRTAGFLRAELKQLQKKLGLTVLYVTHNLEEAGEMADRVCFIKNGSIEQVGAPERVVKYWLSPGQGRAGEIQDRQTVS